MKTERRHATSRRDCGGGFLLTETLAVFVITAFVVLGLASISPVLMRAIDRSVSIIQDSDDLGRTLDGLRRDFSGITRSRWSGPEPQPFVFQGSATGVTFAHREHDQNGLPDVRVIALKELFVDGAPRLFRTDARLPTDATSFETLRPGSRRALPTGPARLRFWYVPFPSADGHPASRQSSWTSTSSLPQAVEVEAVDALTMRTIVTAHIQLHANADIGCIESADAGGGPPGAQGAPTPVAANPPVPQGQAVGPPVPAPDGAAPNPNNALPQSASASVAFCARADKGAPPQPVQAPGAAQPGGNTAAPPGGGGLL